MMFADNDGTITLNDALTVLKYALGIENSDVKYELSDALTCLKIALGIISLD